MSTHLESVLTMLQMPVSNVAKVVLYWVKYSRSYATLIHSFLIISMNVYVPTVATSVASKSITLKQGESM